MESFFARYRNPLVLLAILLAQIIGLAVQVRQTAAGHNTLDPTDSSSVRLIRMWAEMLVAPPERAIHGTMMGVEALWENYIDLHNVRQQNRDLQKTIDRLRLEQAALLQDALQGQRLQSLLGFQQKYIYKTLPAQIIGTSGSDQSRVFYINKGSAEGLERDMAVITPDGIVGKVRDVFPHTAQVLAINDPSSGAGVMLETTGIRGILRGNAYGQLEIVDITADERIKPGDKVLTAGGDLIYPRGLPVGTVEKVVSDPDRDSFIDVVVKPAAQLDRINEVLVITSTQPHFSAQDKQDFATSEAEKGAEAAALEQQLKASQGMESRLPGLIEPNVPADQQPLYDTSNPIPVKHPPLPLHPDRFTPGTSPNTEPAAGDAATQGAAGSAAKPSQPDKPAAAGKPDR